MRDLYRGHTDIWGLTVVLCKLVSHTDMACRNILAVIATMLFVLLTTSESSIKYGRCEVYQDASVIPDLPDTDRYCMVLFDEVEVCREWRCPPLTCQTTQTLDSKCPVCPGMCVHKGQVYIAGETFLHADGVNRCRCRGRNVFYCHRIAATPETMCFY